jgi:hypothetical protein
MKDKIPFGKYLPEMTTSARATLKAGDSVWIVLVKETDNSIIPHVFSRFEIAVRFSNKVKNKLLDSDLKVIPCPIKNNADL